MTLSERKWLAAFRAGDKNAFDTLFHEYAGRVLAFSCQLTGHKAEAEDLTQDVFLAAFRGAERFRGQSRPLTWLLSIAVCRWRDQQRSPQADSVSFDESLSAPFGASSLADQTLASLSLRDALQGLNPAFREAFLLVAAQGLTHREAAEVLERPLGTVKWQVAEATKRLRCALQSQEPLEENPTQKEAAHV